MTRATELTLPLAAMALLALTLIAGRAAAHPLAPVSVLIEQHGADVAVEVKRARVQPRGAAFALRLPDNCRTVGDPNIALETEIVTERYRWNCDSSLVGARLGMNGLTGADVDAVVRVALDDGRVMQGLLDGDGDVFVVPPAPSTVETMRAFASSGLRHLLGGFDHLLFVVGLVLLWRRPRRVLWALTAFTAGHALSMAATAMGFIALPSAVAEVAIAATLVWLAHSVVRRETSATSSSATSSSATSSSATSSSNGALLPPYLMSLGIGLLHGLGFATAFADAGVPPGQLPLALASFHLGIEAGQLAVVAVLLTLFYVVRQRMGKIAWVAAYSIGAVGAMWVFERAALWLGS